MKYIYNMIWCIVLLWLSTGLFNSLVGMWEDGGLWRVAIWWVIVTWTFLCVLLLGIAFKKKREDNREEK